MVLFKKKRVSFIRFDSNNIVLHLKKKEEKSWRFYQKQCFLFASNCLKSLKIDSPENEWKYSDKFQLYLSHDSSWIDFEWTSKELQKGLFHFFSFLTFFSCWLLYRFSCVMERDEPRKEKKKRQKKTKKANVYSADS